MLTIGVLANLSLQPLLMICFLHQLMLMSCLSLFPKLGSPFCIGRLLVRHVLKKLEMDVEYQGNVENRRPLHSLLDVGVLKITTGNHVFSALKLRWVEIYNLWLDDEGNMELDFDSETEDIRIMWDGESNAKDGSKKSVTENYIANCLWRSLRAYLSILYLKLPETFSIRLRGKVVLYHNIATDIKYPEFILYRAHNGGRGRHAEGEVVTTVGFHKDAPNVKVHGFSIYHKRRLILPFLSVVGLGKGRGIIGVLEANYIEPTHNKQEFEKTDVYQKLVNRLREMTHEYWDKRCKAIGCEKSTKVRSLLACPGSSGSPQTPVGCSKTAPAITTVNNRAALNDHSYTTDPIELVPCLPEGPSKGSNMKRKLPDHPKYPPLKNLRVLPGVANAGSNMRDDGTNQKKMALIQQNKQLKDNCLEFEKVEEELNLKVMILQTELQEAQREYDALWTELQLLENVKGENSRYVYV